MKKFLLKACLVLTVYLPNMGWSQDNRPTVTFVDVLQVEENLHYLYPEKAVFEKVRRSISLLRYFFSNEVFTRKADSSFAKDAAAILTDQFSPQNLLFEIAAIDARSIDSLIFCVNVYNQFSQSQLKLFKGTIKVAVNSKANEVIFPLYNPEFIPKDYLNICFYVRKKDADRYIRSMERSDIYLSRTLQALQAKYPAFTVPSKKLRYIIGDGHFKSLEYYSFYNYFYTSRFESDDNTVIDVVASGYYRHEIIHYVFSGYKFNKFLSEGLATLLSGGESLYEGSIEANWKIYQKQLLIDEQYDTALNNADSLLNGRYFPEMYAVSALLLHRYKQKVGATKFYKTLFEKLLLTSKFESLQFLKTELGIEQISDWIKSTEAAVWKEIDAE